ncbi:MAG: hypothetical protein V3T83_05500 [Acidobacteriota bacterium]
MGIPLLAGRLIDRSDIENRRPVGVVTENLAREYWGEPSQALGKRIRHHPDDPWRARLPWRESYWDWPRQQA